MASSSITSSSMTSSAVSLALPDTIRINHKPVVLYGLNGSELSSIALFAAIAGMVLGMMTAGILGSFSLFLIFGLFWGTVLAVALGDWVRNEKRQKPEGYYAQQLCRLMNKRTHALISQPGRFDYLRQSGGSGR